MQNSGDSRFVSRETKERLKAYDALVRKWQTSINLVAPSTLDDMWDRHIEDSLQLFSLSPDPKIWADLGSGAAVEKERLRKHGSTIAINYGNQLWQSTMGPLVDLRLLIRFR